MRPETREKIKENNKKISDLLRENEELLREEGYDPPVNNFAFSSNDKIAFPSKYIRTVSAFNDKYHLYEIFPKRYARQNITYALEVSDLINYFFNRFNIWGAVETVFYKLAIVNLVSVMEAIILEAANNICSKAQYCKKTKTCYKHFNKDERNNARTALNKLVLLDVLDFDEEKLTRVQEVIDLRNRIHIRLTPGSEMQLEDFNLSLYNETISILQDIDEQIYSKGIKMYGCK